MSILPEDKTLIAGVIYEGKGGWLKEDFPIVELGRAMTPDGIVSWLQD
jgi:hypothetical protein